MTEAVAQRRNENSAINRLQPEDRAVHDWYRFVLSFPPHLVRDYLARFGVDERGCVLDPFCGTGTVLVEAKKLGIPSIGIERAPMAQLASRVKVDWTPEPAALVGHATCVADAAVALLAREGNANASLRRLPPDTESLLLAGSISPLPLHKTLVLLQCLAEQRDERWDGHERLALAKALVTSLGNLHFGPEVGVGPAKPDAPVIETWLQNVRSMAQDLEAVRGRRDVPAAVRLADSRSLHGVLTPRSITAVITSPPYPNEKDYTRTTRLESVLLGFVRSKAELRALKRDLVRSNTRGVYKDDNDDRWIATQPQIERLVATIEARRIELGKTSGFERLYARVTSLYFGGMARHLAELRPFLMPGARLAYVVGDQASYFRVQIRTGQLLGEIAWSLGYELVDIDLFRTRLATATRAQLREEVVVLRWPGTAGR
ncbi:MAG TPA: DNA methyltransferase [Dehalococcoidia bacterium]|nr:DNA methyltransferase [Dehalococcoidia bacterium]